jgi:alpha-D-xyloside xylohydrolase
MLALTVLGVAGCSALKTAAPAARDQAVLTLHAESLDRGAPLKLDGMFLETVKGRTLLPASLAVEASAGADAWETQATLDDGRRITLAVRRDGAHFNLRLRAQPDEDILKWGLAVDAAPEEYFTGVMERVVDGPQQASWATNLTAAMNLRGQTVDMILKPTTSVYAPFYLSSRGYAIFAKTDWPGFYDFCAADPQRVKIEFEGPSLELKIYTARHPADLVKAHALDAGPPLLPPKWVYTPWRWRDEHKQRTNYYDGTPVTGPFNSEAMEDVLMMKAFGIPCGAYWIDRPWGPGARGYDDFEIDPNRLPNFAEMIRWMNGQQMQLLLWIGPFFQGEMETNALAKGYVLPGQRRERGNRSLNNYPLADFTNPDARAYWQAGVAKILKLGVAGFKMDRAEEQIPEKGPYRVFDGRSIRENRNAYPVMYLKAAYDIARQHRGEDFVCMPRAAYTGSSPYGVFWGGDVGGTQEGLRASIIALQRSAVMGYPNWGADTCGYNRQLLEQEVCARWLAFSCFNPIMEVGPTKNVGFWNLPREPQYDATLIAVWRLYARLHERLADYGYEQAKIAHKTGLPIVRPLFLVDPESPQAWANWWTFQYGPDLLVSPIWEKNKRTQAVYLPAGHQWRDAWNPGKIYSGGQTITVNAELHQIPIFIRAGSKMELGDLHKEWAESQAIAQTKPNLAALEAGVKAWFEKNRSR